MQPLVDEGTPGWGGGSPIEANYRQQDWQKELYGANYQRLLKVKETYDPESMLYVHTGVGSEA